MICLLAYLEHAVMCAYAWLSIYQCCALCLSRRDASGPFVLGEQAGYNPPRFQVIQEPTRREAKYGGGLQYMSRDSGLGGMAQSRCGEGVGTSSAPFSTQ